MKSTNIKIFRHNFEKLKKVEGGTMDKKLNTLIDIVEPTMPFVEYSNEKTSIKLNQETLNRLDMFRVTLNESRDNIITRMLIMLDELNNTVSEWISFKLTNPYNNLLIIEGQLEYNSRELSFNYRGNVYTGKLPSHYIVEGKDLTKELYLWYDNLDWNEITKLLLDNVDTQTVVDNKDYCLEINDVFSSY
jgi:hypothetical protein